MTTPKPFTRKAEAACYERVMVEWAGFNKGESMWSAMDALGVRGISSLLDVEEETIKLLTQEVKEADGTVSTVTLTYSLRRRIIRLQNFIRHQASLAGGDLGSVDWKSIKAEEFKNFSVNQSGFKSRPAQKSTNYAPVDSFRKGIKLDPEAYPKLKDDKHKVRWHRSMRNTARAQNVANVLDHSYVPMTQEDKDLFEAQQTYLYNVLDNCVFTDRGKEIVRTYYDTSDAQKVYEEICILHKESTSAKLDTSNNLSYLTSMQLGDGSWKGTAVGFLTNWHEKVRIYNDQNPNETLSAPLKRILLENAVRPIPELRQVKVTADLDAAKPGATPLTYEG